MFFSTLQVVSFFFCLVNLIQVPPDFTSALLIQPHENMLMSKLAVFQYINKVNCLIIGYELSETNIVKTEKHSLYSNVYSLFSF